MNVPHHLGAFLTFVFGPVCCWLHSAITWKTYKEERKTEFLITFLCQIAMSFVSTCLLIICILLNNNNFRLKILFDVHIYFRYIVKFKKIHFNKTVNVNEIQCRSQNGGNLFDISKRHLQKGYKKEVTLFRFSFFQYIC